MGPNSCINRSLGGMRLKKKKTDWSVWRYLIYFSQVGVTMITPPLVCAFAAVWLRDKFQWGNGVVIAGIFLGIAIAVVGLRDFLRFTEKKARQSEKEKEDKL